MGCVADSTLREVVCMIRTGHLSASQRAQIIAQMRQMATPRQRTILEQLLTQEHTVYKGTIYDSSLRSETQSHTGATRVSGLTGDKWVGHTTQRYSEDKRVSWDNPRGVGWHWYDKKADPGHETDKPADGIRESDPETNVHLNVDEKGGWEISIENKK